MQWPKQSTNLNTKLKYLMMIILQLYYISKRKWTKEDEKIRWIEFDAIRSGKHKPNRICNETNTISPLHDPSLFSLFPSAVSSCFRTISGSFLSWGNYLFLLSTYNFDQHHDRYTTLMNVSRHDEPIFIFNIAGSPMQSINVLYHRIVSCSVLQRVQFLNTYYICMLEISI